MKKIILSLLALPLTTLAMPLEIENPWVRATVGSQKTTAAYGTFINTSDESLTLVSASTPAASRVELHTHIKHDDGRMEMTKLDTIEIPAGGEFVLKPMDHHLMLMGVTQPLQLGMEIPITLEFEDGTFQTFAAEIQPLNYRMKQDNHHNHGADHHHHSH